MRGIIIFFFVIVSSLAVAQTVSLSGRVLDEKTHVPVEFATVWIQGSAGIGGITDKNGYFYIQNYPEGESLLSVGCLGYASRTLKVEVRNRPKVITVYLSEQTLAIDEVTVIAHRKMEEATTTYTMDRTVLDHLQAVSLADVMSLLPGERTSSLFKLTSGQTLTVRGGGSRELDTPAFGTAIEVDGVRMSTNGYYVSSSASSLMRSADVRNIGSSNIESVEIVTGVPSVEYGDLTNGVVKVNTFKGKTPFLFEASVRPHTQLYSLSKGFDLGEQLGRLNVAVERARSINDLASPYTSYVRNALTLKYSNTWRTRRDKQLDFDFSMNGNIGGLNAETDPDAFKETYSKAHDNALRVGTTVSYLVNSPWISNVSAGLTFAYSDNLSEVKTNNSAASTLPALHTIEEGYFVASKYEDNPSSSVILLPTGYWYTTQYEDNKPLSYSAYVKARWGHRWGQLNSNMLLGGELKGDGNLGKGVYYDDMRTAPTWREYRYDQLPFTQNLALYAEEELKMTFRSSRFAFKAGIRSDMTFIKGSSYGTVSSLSPRFNASYTFAESQEDWLRGITLRGGWGKSVKLPSFAILYPKTTYSDCLAFAPGTMADGTSYYAYYTHPSQLLYNENLKWQYNVMRELGLDIRLKWFRLSLAFFHNTSYRPYTTVSQYVPFEYKLTGQSALESCVIPSSDRIYSINRHTGIVTVSDKTGTYASQQLAYTTLNGWQGSKLSVNGSSSARTGVEWVLDFNKIAALNTSVRIDGKYYRYRGVDETVTQATSSVKMTDGQPYKYVGYYVGGTGHSNGYESACLNTNVTLVTHIPRIRMIFSLRVEGTFINSARYLSEYSSGQRSYVIDDKESYLPSEQGGSIYDGGKYAVSYPLYYVSNDDVTTLIPFKEKFLWAYEHDKSLYNDLSKLVVRTNYGYTFNKQKISPYFSANINITKEIGDHVTVAFYANNFFDSLRKVKNYQTGNEISLFGSGYIPSFNYGISLKLKL